ncbi:MAG: hypothetical protein IKJ63_07360 [Clostridia bacterium]|nr:hypothetical protein [Clostridia bacterium]MBR3955272.1 hypothetical protein [Clostridia bacterium]
MRESYKTTICGVTASLALVLMLLTYINPFLTYTSPPFAGVLLILIMIEVGQAWAFGTYTAISLLALFLLSDKEAAVMFILFFGYYPMLRSVFEKKIKLKAVRYILELLIYNVAIALSVIVCMYVFGVDYDDFGDFGKYSLLITAVLMNVIFVLYDFLVDKLILAYRLRWQKNLHKIFQKK